MEEKLCPTCQGAGGAYVPTPSGNRMTQQWMPCPECKGSGSVPDDSPDDNGGGIIIKLQLLKKKARLPVLKKLLNFLRLGKTRL